MGDLTDTVAVVTGAARGQGRSHAVALAAEGADIIAVDLCADMESIPYPLATKADLDETVELVKQAGRRAVAVVADVRDLDVLQSGIQGGIDELGDVDIVVANAGVLAIGRKDPADVQLYRDIVDVNLNGVWHTIVSTVPSMIRKGRGGSIILISSMAGLVGRGGDGSAAMFAYTASKHGVVGLMRSAAHAYADQNIRVNSVHPTGVITPMVTNDYVMKVMQDNPSSLAGNLLPVPCVEPEDVTNAVVWLAGPKSRYVTGVTMPVDAGHAVM